MFPENIVVSKWEESKGKGSDPVHLRRIAHPRMGNADNIAYMYDYEVLGRPERAGVEPIGK